MKAQEIIIRDRDIIWEGLVNWSGTSSFTKLQINNNTIAEDFIQEVFKKDTNQMKLLSEPEPHDYVHIAFWETIQKFERELFLIKEIQLVKLTNAQWD
jgi:hypothetical protein